MATSSSSTNDDETRRRTERQNRVMLGELPPDFLRVTPMTNEQQLANDEQAALALQQQVSESIATNVTGRLTLSVIQAKLTKNYGFTRMDLYARIRVGNNMFETHTDNSAGKNPRWNKIFHCFLFSPVSGIYIEIFDECSFTLDEKIAWAHYTLPETFFNGQVFDEWIPLNGRQGEGKEGSINISLCYAVIPAGTVVYPPQPVVAVMPSHYYIPQSVPCATPPLQACTPYQSVNPVAGQPVQAVPQAQVALHHPVQITDADVQQVKEMFPDVEEEVIRSVMENQGGNKDKTVNALLQMSEGS